MRRARRGEKVRRCGRATSLVLVAGLALGVVRARDLPQRARRLARRRVDDATACVSRRSAGRCWRAAWSPRRGGRRAASARCWRRPGAPGSPSSSTTPASARRSLFTLGLMSYAACPAIVAHAALAYPERPGRRPARARRHSRSPTTSTLARPRACCPPLAFDPGRAGLRRHARTTCSPSRAPRRRRGGRRAPAWSSAWSGRPLLAPWRSARLVRSSSAARRLTAPGARSRRRLPRARGGRLRPRRSGAASSPTTRVDRDLWLAQAAALGAARARASARRGCAGGGRARGSRGS